MLTILLLHLLLSFSLETVFHQLSKHVEFRRKYSVARRILNYLLSVWISRWNTVSLVFILYQQEHLRGFQNLGSPAPWTFPRGIGLDLCWSYGADFLYLRLPLLWKIIHQTERKRETKRTKKAAEGRKLSKRYWWDLKCFKVIHYNLSNKASLMGKPLELVRSMKRLLHGAEYVRP